MFEFLRNVFSGGSGEAAAAADPVDYNGFRIVPSPQRSEGGWRVHGVISKESQGEVRTHEFIRADSISDRDGAIEMTISKAKRTIDEQGERLFGDK